MLAIVLKKRDNDKAMTKKQDSSLIPGKNPEVNKLLKTIHKSSSISE